MQTIDFDVLIVGAGLSGISAAYYLQTRCPNKRYTILEGRSAIGGTWDLFRYPGIRSDSDMYTLGYAFRPWHSSKAIADGASILQYIRETAQIYGIDQQIRFEQMVRRVSWSSEQARWTVEVERLAEGDMVQYRCNFLYMCGGYYDYSQGYTPEWPSLSQFQGQVVHPQAWPQQFDYRDQRVVVIGSGATAITLVPAMAKQAAHVTMLQRSPSYVVAQPAHDQSAERIRRWLPAKLAFHVIRWRAIIQSIFYYLLMRGLPSIAKRALIKMAQQELGTSYDAQRHFTPNYNPWDQRLCLAPDGDFFKALKAGQASVVTDQIEHFTSTGIQLKSGQHIDADLIVTATGLNLRLLSGIEVLVDGRKVELGTTLNYKGMMLSDVPNLALAFGYTNASWTLKCELTSMYVCRLLNYMDRHGYAYCVPKNFNPAMATEPALNFTSSYVQRVISHLPRQGRNRPWKLYQNYLLDLLMLRLGTLDDGNMEFLRPWPNQRQVE
ncbi:flavin-containing monooxygenase [Herpetosiphon llansteffanensis]|uniref:flavin-containing monooxygenase n=1 Tax=Herpetosiphon llansteffanensis TaxID=2094568 RepID=UPI000D7BF6C6|nr:NAD(P)/FAD-dependent oxidoreductase [Herpetosiphon llansteffanensis]